MNADHATMPLTQGGDAMAGLSPFEVAARRFERRADPSVDLELWNMIRAAKGLPAQTLAEAEADVRACIDSGQYAQALTRLEQG